MLREFEKGFLGLIELPVPLRPVGRPRTTLLTTHEGHAVTSTSGGAFSALSHSDRRLRATRRARICRRYARCPRHERAYQDRLRMSRPSVPPRLRARQRCACLTRAPSPSSSAAPGRVSGTTSRANPGHRPSAAGSSMSSRSSPATSSQGRSSLVLRATVITRSGRRADPAGCFAPGMSSPFPWTTQTRSQTGQGRPAGDPAGRRVVDAFSCGPGACQFVSALGMYATGNLRRSVDLRVARVGHLPLVRLVPRVPVHLLRVRVVGDCAVAGDVLAARARSARQRRWPSRPRAPRSSGPPPCSGPPPRRRCGPGCRDRRTARWRCPR